MIEDKTTKLFYKQLAQKHEKYFVLGRLMQPESRTIIPELDLQDGIKVLDVACGNGKLIFSIANILKNYELHGIDISSQKIKNCQRKNGKSNIKFTISPADNIPFLDNYFDLILCTNAISKFPKRVKAIDEMHRVLKPGGKAYLLEGVINNDYKQKFDKILRQTKFIQPRKKYLNRSSILSKSYLIIAVK